MRNFWFGTCNNILKVPPFTHNAKYASTHFDPHLFFAFISKWRLIVKKCLNLQKQTRKRTWKAVEKWRNWDALPHWLKCLRLNWVLFAFHKMLNSHWWKFLPLVRHNCFPQLRNFLTAFPVHQLCRFGLSTKNNACKISHKNTPEQNFCTMHKNSTMACKR